MQCHHRIIAGNGNRHRGEYDDGRDEGEDYAGGEAGEEVADVAAGAAVLEPLLVVVEGAALAHAPLLDGVRPVRDGVEEGV